jgi:hypothetical protein
MTMFFEKGKKAFSDFCESQWFFCKRIPDEIKLHAGLIPTEFCLGIQCPKIITACFAFLADIPVGMKELQIVFLLHG